MRIKESTFRVTLEIAKFFNAVHARDVHAKYFSAECLSGLVYPQLINRGWGHHLHGDQFLLTRETHKYLLLCLRGDSITIPVRTKEGFTRVLVLDGDGLIRSGYSTLWVVDCMDFDDSPVVTRATLKAAMS